MKTNEKNIVNEIVKDRIKENEKLFTKQELKFIKNSNNIIKKIYLIGLIDGKNIWK